MNAYLGISPIELGGIYFWESVLLIWHMKEHAWEGKCSLGWEGRKLLSSFEHLLTVCSFSFTVRRLHKTDSGEWLPRCFSSLLPPIDRAISPLSFMNSGLGCMVPIPSPPRQHDSFSPMNVHTWDGFDADLTHSPTPGSYSIEQGGTNATLLCSARLTNHIPRWGWHMQLRALLEPG